MAGAFAGLYKGIVKRAANAAIGVGQRHVVKIATQQQRVRALAYTLAQGLRLLASCFRRPTYLSRNFAQASL